MKCLFIKQGCFFMTKQSQVNQILILLEQTLEKYSPEDGNKDLKRVVPK